MNASFNPKLLATHKECTALGETLYQLIGDKVNQWNGIKWVELNSLCSAQDFLKKMQSIGEKNSYNSKPSAYLVVNYSNPIYPRSGVIGAYQGD